jgi:hypothetical protein
VTQSPHSKVFKDVQRHSKHFWKKMMRPSRTPAALGIDPVPFARWPSARGGRPRGLVVAQSPVCTQSIAAKAIKAYSRPPGGHQKTTFSSRNMPRPEFVNHWRHIACSNPKLKIQPSKLCKNDAKYMHFTDFIGRVEPLWRIISVLFVLFCHMHYDANLQNYFLISSSEGIG